MSVFLITYLLDCLLTRYDDLEKENLWKNRKYLDVALSSICNMQHNENLDKKKVKKCVQNINDSFFELFSDEKTNVKAFIYTLIIKRQV